jgi:hypothetical protein
LAISGATVSSWSVCAIVNSAVDQWREPILQAVEEEGVAGNTAGQTRGEKTGVRLGSRSRETSDAKRGGTGPERGTVPIS